MAWTYESLEAYGTSGLPGNYIALRIRDGNDRVIESGFDVRSANSNVLTFRTLDAGADVFLAATSYTSTSSCRRFAYEDPCGYERSCECADRERAGHDDDADRDSNRSP